jgi:hypothetical protein
MSCPGSATFDFTSLPAPPPSPLTVRLPKFQHFRWGLHEAHSIECMDTANRPIRSTTCWNNSSPIPSLSPYPPPLLGIISGTSANWPRNRRNSEREYFVRNTPGASPHGRTFAHLTNVPRTRPRCPRASRGCWLLLPTPPPLLRQQSQPRQNLEAKDLYSK